uniref:Putative ubiquinone oxidoreductase ndufb8/ashi subunit n=1 Tax=Triatoma dimidiata TaxID=72491 RepID=A0A0V0G753_TRIDM
MSFLKTTLIYSMAKRSFSGTPAFLAHWNKDWKPGKYPTTEEEKLAAAKKYNLFPEEYVPVKDDGHGAGDYPGFKPYSVESRDPFYPWDFPEYRRNFNEPLHEDINIYGEDRYDVLMKPRFPLILMLASFILTMGSCIYLTYKGKDTAFLPAMPQHMPAPGVKRYTYQ